MRMIENGMVDYREPKPVEYRCPVCGEECETVYRNAQGEIVGCNECVERVDAWEALDD